MKYKLDPLAPTGIAPDDPKQDYKPYFAGGPGKPSLLDSVNGKHGAVQITAGTNVTVDNTGTDIVISATGGGGGGSYTDEQAQDAVGTILTDSTELDFAYDDATPSITASIKAGSIDESKLDTSTNASLDLADSAVQPAGIANFETTTQLNARDTANRARANHTGTQTASTISDFNTAADARISNAAGSSVASLVAGLVPTSQIPAQALTTVQTAASQAAMLALTTQAGDIVVRSDEHKSYMHNGGSAGTMADFTLLDTPSDAVTSVNSQTGTVVLAKGDIGLGNVDNTSNATERAAVATLTNKDLSSGTNTFPTLNQNTTGSAAKWTTARNLAGNSVDGSANVAFANKFIVQGTSDSGLSAAQFLGALGTGIVKNTTTTGALSIAVAADFPTLNQNTTGSAATLTTSRNIDGQAFNGSADITVVAPGTHAATSKTTPVDADEIPLVDSAASNILKKLTWANLKATIKSYSGTAAQSSTLLTTTTGADIAGCTFTISPTVASTVYVWFNARADTSAAGNEIQVQLTDSVDGVKIAYTGSPFDIFCAGSRMISTGALSYSYNIASGSRTIKVQGISSSVTTGNIQFGKLTYLVVSQ